MGKYVIDELNPGLVRKYIEKKHRSFGTKKNILDTFTQTTPGAAFQFVETYQGPGLANQTIIERTTDITSVTETTSIFSQ